MSLMKPTITFVTIGDIAAIATMKRALGMANPLTELGWDVSIIAMDCEENRKRISFECGKAVNVFFYAEGSVKSEVSQKTELVRQIDPDYVYFCSFSTRNRILKRKIKYKGKIIIEHSELPSSIKNKKFSRRILDWIVERYSVVYADLLVCASKYLVSYYTGLALFLLKNRMPIDYSPYAFNEEVIRAEPVILNQLMQKYKDRKIFLYMGTMTKNYGLFTMLQAAEKLKTDGQSEFVLLMLGGGPDLEEAKIYIEKRKLTDVVVFTGYTPEEHLSSYFKLTSAFISPINNSIQDIARCPSKIYMYLPFSKPVFTCQLGEPFQIFGEKGHYFLNDNPATLTALMDQEIKGGLNKTPVDVKEHSWTKRSVDFNKWIKSLHNK